MFSILAIWFAYNYDVYLPIYFIAKKASFYP